ncbi:PAS domain-containing protein [Tistlia consotensis]|uniref:PAS domain-containing protein n=1 Tax=Tistlia consotensis USBA 355 TaxID=560819 RepID=A0A1Y6BJL4_9PROT|nr:PAS domain-containing protein [Tistlia consotensis]SMF14554.1 PAS domain-containing protein [Tistlia consotensis USBA 355]SNR49446.1 PAS domain-containing protein [Tistlia consotensis]
MPDRRPPPLPSQRQNDPASAAPALHQEFADPRLPSLFDHWQAIRGTRIAPLGRDLELAAIPRLLPIIDLIEVLRAPLRFRHRLFGSELVARNGRDVTGLEIDAALHGDAATEIRATLATIVEQVRPYRRLARQDWANRPWLSVEAIELPLVDETGAVVQILRGVTYGIVQPPLEQRLSFEPLLPPERPVRA